MAYCANSSIVCSGIIIGSLCGGVLGGMIGAAVTTWLGVLTERMIADKIADPVIRGQFEEATLGRILYETIRNVAAAGAAGVIGEYLMTVTPAAFSAAWKAVGEALGKALGVGGEVASYAFLKLYVLNSLGDKQTLTPGYRLANALIKGELPAEWFQAQSLMA